jgi:hypothetical protein
VTLEKRREMLTEDNDKIFRDFSRVVDLNSQSKSRTLQINSVLLSKKDL